MGDVRQNQVFFGRKATGTVFLGTRAHSSLASWIIMGQKEGRERRLERVSFVCFFVPQLTIGRGRQ